MNIPELYFQDVDEVIEWHRREYPESYSAYIKLRESVGDAGFPGAVKLLKNVDSKITVIQFLSFLAELNIAALLLGKKVPELSYESIPGVDFCFDDIAVSVKNLHTKKYEKIEQESIRLLKRDGGGTVTHNHKIFSDAKITVKRTKIGTFSYERLETGNYGHLDSDLAELSMPFSYLNKLENTSTAGLKRVLLLFIQEDGFPSYYAYDMAHWYFEYNKPGYRSIFEDDMMWYGKLFKKEVKKNNVEGIIFIYAPNTLLSWPDNCLSDTSDRGVPRVLIYTRDQEFHDRLRRLFS